MDKAIRYTFKLSLNRDLPDMSQNIMVDRKRLEDLWHDIVKSGINISKIERCRLDNERYDFKNVQFFIDQKYENKINEIHGCFIAREGRRIFLSKQETVPCIPAN